MPRITRRRVAQAGEKHCIRGTILLIAVVLCFYGSFLCGEKPANAPDAHLSGQKTSDQVQGKPGASPAEKSTPSALTGTM